MLTGQWSFPDKAPAVEVEIYFCSVLQYNLRKLEWMNAVKNLSRLHNCPDQDQAPLVKMKLHPKRFYLILGTYNFKAFHKYLKRPQKQEEPCAGNVGYILCIFFFPGNVGYILCIIVSIHHKANEPAWV